MSDKNAMDLELALERGDDLSSAARQVLALEHIADAILELASAADRIAEELSEWNGRDE